MQPSPFMDRYHATMEFLRDVVANRGLLVELEDDERIELVKLCGMVSIPDHEARKSLVTAFRKVKKGRRKAHDKELLASTGLRVSQASGGVTVPFFQRPPPSLANGDPLPILIEEMPEPSELTPKVVLNKQRACYVCGKRYSQVHHFYASMCIPCGDFNYERRLQTYNLSGRVALVTGGRVKIGFHISLKLLRAGCRVIVVTRFARDAVVRFSKEADFDDWCGRLQVHGVDLRHTPSVEAFCDVLLKTLPRLDFIIHNACQTVRRPTSFYRHMWKREQMALDQLRPEEQKALAVCKGVVDPVLLSQIELLQEDQVDHATQDELFPPDVYDVDMQQVDLRAINSWRLELADVSTTEVLETHLCNAIAPFVMNGRLKPLMCNSTGEAHIVNVSAMEGQFYRVFKTTSHPQTNMAK